MGYTRYQYMEHFTPSLQWIKDSQVEQIHFATLELLDRTGMRVDNRDALRLLKDAGCLVENNRVRFPKWLVEECIRSAPSSISISDREGRRTMFLEKNRVYFGTGSDLPFILDDETKERRNSVKRDVANSAILTDYLPCFDFVMSNALASDYDPRISDVHNFDAMVRNTTKPIVFTAFSVRSTERIIEMASLVAGGCERLRRNPFVILYSEPISPLVHSIEGVEKMFKCFDYGIPVVYVPGVVAGSSTPVTKAGTVVQMNAEALAGVVIAQLYRKGAPIIIGGGATPMDMKTTTTLYGSPDAQMNYCVMTRLSQFYGIPNFTEAGCTNAPIPDCQAGMEAAIGILMAQLTGANLVHDVGYLEGGKTGSLAFLVICNEFISAARYMGQGTRISDETVALDVIDEVGPAGGFLDHPHTLKHFRDEIWDTSLFNRVHWPMWQQAGRKDLYEKAKERVRDILNTHKPKQLDADIVEGLDRMLKDCSRETDSDKGVMG